MNREELIEEAAETMHDAYEAAAVREGWETQERSRKPWSEVPEANKRTMLIAVEAALTVFEKAQAPADDEREALSNFLFSVYEHGSQPNALREADAILSFLASHRLAQTEPTDAQIEAALRALILSPEVPTGVRPGFVEGEVLVIRERTDAEPIVRAALKAAFTAGQEER